MGNDPSIPTKTSSYQNITELVNQHFTPNLLTQKYLLKCCPALQWPFQKHLPHNTAIIVASRCFTCTIHSWSSCEVTLCSAFQKVSYTVARCSAYLLQHQSAAFTTVNTMKANSYCRLKIGCPTLLIPSSDLCQLAKHLLLHWEKNNFIL